MLDKYRYHAKICGITGKITRPVYHEIKDHAKSELHNNSAGSYWGEQGAYEIPGILSYAACSTHVVGREESDGVFRTELEAIVKGFRVTNDGTGEVVVETDNLVMGMVTVYHRKWHVRGGPHVNRPRVLPVGCDFGKLMIQGKPHGFQLPAPFSYDQTTRETYLNSDSPDPAIEAEIQAAIDSSAARSIQIPNFGTIYFGQWGIVNAGGAGRTHGITMLRLKMGSPQEGDLDIEPGEGNGGGPPP